MSYEYQFDTDRYPECAYPADERIPSDLSTPLTQYEMGLWEGVTDNLPQILLDNLHNPEFINGYLDGVREAIASKKYMLVNQGLISTNPDAF